MQRLALNVATGAVIAFLIGPLVVVVFGSLTSTSYIAFPPHGLTLKWYRELWAHPDLLQAFIVSLVVAGSTSVASTAIGTLAALALHSDAAFWREGLRNIVLSPLILPTVVTGVALYDFLQKVNIGSAYIGLIIGHTLITIPYVVRTVGAALFELDPGLAEAAAGLGAGWARVLREVVLPAILPAMVASVLLVFIVSFDQVSLSIFLADPDTTPLPVRLYSYLQFGLDPMVAAVSALMIVFAYVLVVLIERLFGLGQLFAKG